MVLPVGKWEAYREEKKELAFRVFEEIRKCLTSRSEASVKASHAWVVQLIRRKKVELSCSRNCPGHYFRSQFRRIFSEVEYTQLTLSAEHLITLKWLFALWVYKYFSYVSKTEILWLEERITEFNKFFLHRWAEFLCSPILTSLKYALCNGGQERLGEQRFFSFRASSWPSF